MEVTIQGASIIWKKAPNSCYVIDDHIMLDCGEGVTKTFGDSYESIDDIIKRIDTIIITHYHSDHYFGLMPILSHYLSYAKPEDYKKLTIYGPKGLKQVLTMLRNLGEGVIQDPSIDIGLDKVINLIEIDFDKSKKPTFNVSGYDISCYDLNHGDIPDIGYIFDDGSQKIGFSGDCTYNENLEDFVQNTDRCFLDCAGPKTSTSHLGLDRFLEFKEKYPNKQFIPIHCSNGVCKIADEYGIRPSTPGDTYSFGNPPAENKQPGQPE